MVRGNPTAYGYVPSTVSGELVRAYVPPPLPPVRGLHLESFQSLLEESSRAVGRLDGVSGLLTNLPLFLYSYVRKEAVLSSQIEGTQSSLSDLLTFENAEAPGVPLGDVEEVSNYVAALTYGLGRMREGFPLSLRLIREIHGVLMARGRGSHARPGEFRQSQNWIGGSRPGNAAFVPPPPERLAECLDALEKFVHFVPAQRPPLPLLVRAGLIHAQFETIHPFLDGNGRVGRLLITFLLCAEGMLGEPVLYLSLYFKKHRQLYYSLLNGTRGDGEGWTAWIDFFLQGVAETATQATSLARRIEGLFAEDRVLVEGLGRSSVSALAVYRHAQRQPIFSINGAAKESGLSFPTVSGAVDRMVDAGLLHEMSGRQRGRLFCYRQYLHLLNEDMQTGTG
jgi:Fic family protein